MPLGPPDLSGTALRFATPVVHRRYGPPVPTAEGLENDPEPVDTAGLAHHWPEPRTTLERAPEGYETTEIRAGTTALDLRIEDRTTRARADSILVGEAEYTVISTRLLAGRTLVHVFADAQPGPAFEPVEPSLEDVYFSTMHGHLSGGAVLEKAS